MGKVVCVHEVRKGFEKVSEDVVPSALGQGRAFENELPAGRADHHANIAGG